MDAHQVLDGVRGTLAPHGVPGAIVGVRHRGALSMAAAGTTNPDGDDALRPDAVVRLSSNTKPLVAALALVLVADGALALDEPVDRLLPELAGHRVLERLDGTDTVPADRSITVEDLLTMRMGFGWTVDEGPCPTLERAMALGLGFGPPDPLGPPPPDEWIARLAELPFLDQPGRTWRYELSFGVLGVLLARAAGRPLDVVLADRLLAPLGMVDTGFVATGDRLVPAFVRGDDGRPAPFDGVADSRWRTPPAFPDAQGGLVGSAADLLRFAGMLLEGGAGLLDGDAAAAMTTDRLTPDQRAAPAAAAFLDGGGWGYGLGVVDTPVGRRHGWAGGLGTLWYSWPDHDLAAVLVTQVLPPTGPVFAAFTSTVEDALAR
ncbi:serine hydrolase [Actinomycetospora sp. NBRC 106375]|uniref:serine hydrolase domain-containing protein n=1 Tax=Actinomycetospora sp. NBRC 106375 TaxID=3032207 RepID=UPI0024A47048|nr:serine hydrolase domain-containing protein [Actinomycetospora sp. NBRC 106375]GLZ45358.1 serine hydrolase [Actinomycetospora sp. NBRC 106375]